MKRRATTTKSLRSDNLFATLSTCPRLPGAVFRILRMIKPSSFVSTTCASKLATTTVVVAETDLQEGIVFMLRQREDERGKIRWVTPACVFPLIRIAIEVATRIDSDAANLPRSLIVLDPIEPDGDADPVCERSVFFLRRRFRGSGRSAGRTRRHDDVPFKREWN